MKRLMTVACVVALCGCEEAARISQLVATSDTADIPAVTVAPVGDVLTVDAGCGSLVVHVHGLPADWTVHVGIGMQPPMALHITDGDESFPAYATEYGWSLQVTTATGPDPALSPTGKGCVG